MAKKNIIPVFLNQQGCPFHCLYCRQETLWESQETLSPAQLAGYLRTLPPKHYELAFYGGTFTGLPLETQEQYLEVAAQAKAGGIIQEVRLSTRPDLLGADALNLLRRYEVDTVEVGAQSLVDEVLSQSGRGYLAMAVTQAVRDLRAAGLTVGLQLMCGLPGDNRENFNRTLAATIALRPDFVRLYPTLVFKDTPLARLYQSGAYQPLTLETAIEWGADAATRFQAAGIKLIRLGLHLSGEAEILAGPAHPAYGQMVKSRILRRQVEIKLENLKETGSKQVVFSVPHRWLSDFLGVKRQEFDFLRNKYSQWDLSWESNETPASLYVRTANISYQIEVN